jgi:hypothetical protein
MWLAIGNLELFWSGKYIHVEGFEFSNTFGTLANVYLKVDSLGYQGLVMSGRFDIVARRTCGFKALILDSKIRTFFDGTLVFWRS